MSALMTVEDVATMFCVNVQTVRRWCRQRKIRGVRLGRRWLFETSYIHETVRRMGASNQEFGADVRRRLGGRRASRKG